MPDATTAADKLEAPNLSSTSDSESPRPEPVDREPLPDRAAYGTEIGDRVQEALALLSERERAAFVLRHFEERSIKEIAAALSQSDNATKQALFRAVRKLRAALAEDAGHEICLIDCPPSLGLLTLNAMTAANSLLVPLQCEFFALEGLSQLLQTVERVQERFNPDLGILGIVLTMYDRRNRLTDQVADDVRSCLHSLVFESVIPRNVRLSEAPSHGLPALIYDHACAGSQAYMKLARELIGRLPERRIAA